MGACDRYSLDGAERSRSRTISKWRAPSSTPSCRNASSSRFSVEVGRAHQPGFHRAEKLHVRANARCVAPARSFPQARALRRRRTRRANATRSRGSRNGCGRKFPQGSVSINLAFAGILLAIFRQVAAFAPSVTDRAIMRKGMQDARAGFLTDRMLALPPRASPGQAGRDRGLPR